MVQLSGTRDLGLKGQDRTRAGNNYEKRTVERYPDPKVLTQ